MSAIRGRVMRTKRTAKDVKGVLLFNTIAVASGAGILKPIRQSSHWDTASAAPKKRTLPNYSHSPPVSTVEVSFASRVSHKCGKGEVRWLN